MAEFRSIERDEWFKLREVRIHAVSESPETFLATPEAEKGHSPEDWLAEFDRGSWIVGEFDDQVVSLVGITHEKTHAMTGGQPRHFVEYMWVAPSHRKLGIARETLNRAIDAHFRHSAVVDNDAARRCLNSGELHLWVLDGNWPAIWLYKRMGFDPTDDSHPLVQKPGRSEERMVLNLAWHFSSLGC